jgi:hypothetical protein
MLPYVNRTLLHISSRVILRCFIKDMLILNFYFLPPPFPIPSPAYLHTYLSTYLLVPTHPPTSLPNGDDEKERENDGGGFEIN